MIKNPVHDIDYKAKDPRPWLFYAHFAVHEMVTGSHEQYVLGVKPFGVEVNGIIGFILKKSDI